MKYPILFKGEMVRGVLAGLKTQTRRVIKHQPAPSIEEIRWSPVRDWWEFREGDKWREAERSDSRCPYGRPGDTLWVRETLKRGTWEGMAEPASVYAADCSAVWDVTQPCPWIWKRSVVPSIHMPRAACRLLLTVQSVRVERVQAISPTDALREGVYADNALVRRDADDAVVEFEWLWDSINAKRGYSWESNPWVWVVEFEVQK